MRDPTPISPRPLPELQQLLEAELARIAEPRRATLRALLVAPELRALDWHYGDEDQQHLCWLIARTASGLTLAYCDDGFGPSSPWGYLLAGDGMGMDSQWHAHLEDAAIGARILSAPSGYQVRGP